MKTALSAASNTDAGAYIGFDKHHIKGVQKRAERLLLIMATTKTAKTANPDQLEINELTEMVSDAIFTLWPQAQESSVNRLLAEAWDGETDIKQAYLKYGKDGAFELAQAVIDNKKAKTIQRSPSGETKAMAQSKTTVIQMTPTDYVEDPFGAPDSPPWLRLCLEGPENAGKTFSGLRLAYGMKPDARVAVIDTERGSAAKYKRQFPNFKHMVVTPPFHPQKLTDLINAAVKYGYDFVILDSLTHWWRGEGGVLDINTAVASTQTKGDSFSAWRVTTPIQNEWIDAMLNAPIHVIATMRTKKAYEVNKQEGQRATITKLGLEPIQRDDLGYEFDVVLKGMDGEFTVEKTRCSDLKDKVFKYPGEDVAEILVNWLA